MTPAEIVALAAEALRDAGVDFTIGVLDGDVPIVALSEIDGPQRAARMVALAMYLHGRADRETARHVAQSDVESLAEDWYDAGASEGKERA